MIRSEKQYLVTRKQWAKFNEAILRVERRGVATVGDLLLGEVEHDALVSQRDELAEQMGEYDRRVNGDRVGHWMPLFTGKRFWPEDPRPQDIDIVDIAHSLARINRFNGHTSASYSVAQHSVLVSRILSRGVRLFGLMHDAGECYLGDIITPVKRLFRDFYEEAELKVMRAVATRYGFACQLHSGPFRAAVKRADLVLLATEFRDLMNHAPTPEPLPELPLDEQIRPWSAERAEWEFLFAFRQLSGEAAVAA